MDKISNELLGYIALATGVVIGWFLRGLWRSIRSRRERAKLIDPETYGWLVPGWGSVRERRRVKDRRISDIMFKIVKDAKTTFKEWADALRRSKAILSNPSFDAECVDGKFRIKEK